MTSHDGAEAVSSAAPQTARHSTARAPRRVLIVASTLHVGGAERVIATLAKNLDRSRFDVTVCYMKENGVVGEEIANAGTTLLPLPDRHYGRPDRLTFIKLRKLIRERGIELIHTHDVHGFIDGSACRLITPGLRHIHTFHFGNYPHRQPRYRQIERALWRVPDRLVAVGHAQAESIRALYKIPKHRLDILWNGVEPPKPRLSPVVQEAIRDCAVPIIASISTLIEQKGLHHLIAAAALLKQKGAAFRLLIVGDGHLRESLQRQVRELQLQDHVKFLGWVPAASDCALPACDIFVQSSLWEAMSVVVLEAMASGKAMAITRVGENPYVIKDGVTGLTVPSADPSGLAEALYRLCMQPELRRRLGEAAQEDHAQRFTVAHMIDAHERLYMDVLVGQRRSAA